MKMVVEAERKELLVEGGNATVWAGRRTEAVAA